MTYLSIFNEILMILIKQSQMSLGILIYTGKFKILHNSCTLQPIFFALDHLQKDAADIPDAPDKWIALLQNPELKPHVRAVADKFTKAIPHHHVYTYLMHKK